MYKVRQSKLGSPQTTPMPSAQGRPLAHDKGYIGCYLKVIFTIFIHFIFPINWKKNGSRVIIELKDILPCRAQETNTTKTLLLINTKTRTQSTQFSNGETYRTKVLNVVTFEKACNKEIFIRCLVFFFVIVELK